MEILVLFRVLIYFCIIFPLLQKLGQGGYSVVYIGNGIGKYSPKKGTHRIGQEKAVDIYLKLFKDKQKRYTQLTLKSDNDGG